MPKLKIVIRSQEIHKNKDGLFDVKIRVTHQGKTRYIGTGIYVDKKQINVNGNIINHPNSRQYNIKLRNILNVYDQKIFELPTDVKKMSMGSLIAYLREIDTAGRENDFLIHAEKIVKDLFSKGRDNYAISFESMIAAIKEFISRDRIDFNEITQQWLQEFYDFFTEQKRKPNTIAVYQRNIRVVFNDAIKKKLVSRDLYPFYDYTIRSEQTRKRSLDIEDIKKIRDVSLSQTKSRARDLFLLSFYMNGINFKDLLLARKSDVYKNRLEFNRAKTGRNYSILIQPEAWEIINRYQGRKVPLYKDITDQTNRFLKKVAGEAKVDVPLSTYFARHSLATIARNIGVSKDDIRSLLGHGENSITDIYIDLDLERIDQAMRTVLDSLK
jgi:site-specific recombinase XerD